MLRRTSGEAAWAEARLAAKRAGRALGVRMKLEAAGLTARSSWLPLELPLG
jgi:hypothetical protein